MPLLKSIFRATLIVIWGIFSFFAGGSVEANPDWPSERARKPLIVIAVLVAIVAAIALAVVIFEAST